ncbi:MAG: DNA mismatch endonuclease Vsr [Phycisphaerales bacterium]|nr:DNA mismatch endonuclease Vsr [Phycisphaerales bacterium]
MADTLTPEQRSRCMSKVRSKNTAPERLVAAELRARGIRCRRHAKNLPGAPDFVVTRAKIAIFVHGCWWHAHNCPRGSRTPKTNRRYWSQKIARNVTRDRRAARELRAQGWSVWTIWECRLKGRGVPPRLLRKLDDTLDSAADHR